jgi:hypothetical protein
MRTEPRLSRKLPSAWIYPAATGYVATATITAPTSLASSGVTSKAAILTWTVGEADKRVVLQLVGAASEGAANAATPVDYAVLAPGTSRYDLSGLDSGGPWWHATVYHIDDYGGSSSGNNLAAFQATGTAATAPTPGGLLIIRDLSSSPAPIPNATFIQDGVAGVDLMLVPAPAGMGLDGELYRAPDSGGSPGSYALLATIPGGQFAGRAYAYRDRLPVTGTQYWYKWRHTGAGLDASGYTIDTAAKAGWLPNIVYGVDPGQPVLGIGQRMRILYTAMVPLASGTTYDVSPGYLVAGTATVKSTFIGSVPVPAGSVLGTCRARLFRNDTGGTAEAKATFYAIDQDGGAFVSGSTLAATNSNGQTLSDTTLSGTLVTPTTAVLLKVELTFPVTQTNARFVWGEVDYVPNSFAQLAPT